MTAQPRKKSPTYAEAKRRPKTKTHFNRQSTTTSDQQQKHQLNLEAIQTLLQQVQSQLNSQIAPRQQPKLKKTDRQTTRPKTFLYDPIVVHSDNDGDFFRQQRKYRNSNLDTANLAETSTSKKYITIFNLSNRKLSKHEMSVLLKEL